MKTLRSILALLALAAASPAFGQVPQTRLWSSASTGTISASGSAVTLSNISGQGAAKLQITGTYSGTLEVQCSVNGTTFDADDEVMLTKVGATSQVASITDNSEAIWDFNVVGCQAVRLISTAWVSGDAVVTIASAPTGGGGGSGAGGTFEGEVVVSAQPADNPHFVRCSDGSVASPCLVSATNLDVQSGGADLATSAQGAAIQTAVEAIDNAVSGAGFNVTQFAGAAVPMTTTQADDLANTLDGLNTTTFLYAFDGTTWDRMPGTSALGLTVNTEMPAAAAITDNFANPTTVSVMAMNMCWDGSAWDRCSAAGADTELPAAAALADDTSNPTVPGVAAFLMCFDGSTWDRCPTAAGGSGTIDANTGRITIATDDEVNNSLDTLDNIVSGTGVNISQLAGATTPMTTTQANDLALTLDGLNVTAFNYIYDGTTYDMMAGGSGVITGGTTRVNIAIDDPVNDALVELDTLTVAHGASDAGNVGKLGFVAETTIAGSTPVTDGQRSHAYGGADGVLYVRPHAPLEDLVQETVTNTNGTSTAFTVGLAAAGSGVKIYLTECTVSNTSTSAGGTVDLRDGSGGSVVWTLPVPVAPTAGVGGGHFVFHTPVEFSANTAVAYDVSAAITTVSLSCAGFKSKL